MSFETKEHKGEPVHVRVHRRVYAGSAAARYLERGPALQSPHQNDWRRAVARPGVSSWIRRGDHLYPRDSALESKQAAVNRGIRTARVGHPVGRVPVRRVRNPTAYNRRYVVYPRSPYSQYSRPAPAARHTVRGRGSVSDRAEFDIGSVAPPAARRRRVPVTRGAYYTQQTRRRRWW